MRRLVLLALLATAHAQDETARDLTVRLFDTDRVASVTVTPLGANATWKPCAGCASRPLTAVQTIGLAGRPSVTLNGDVRVETDTHRRASAFGVWRIDGERDALRVRVRLPSERYVAAVLAAEAAGDEPPASLRALAVVVRSYALTHKGELTDSTSTQTLRLGAVSETVAAAVRETAGETLWFRGRQVAGYFTQSSGGTTESSDAAWGGEPQPWLPMQPDPASERTPSQWHGEIALADLRTALAGQGFAVKSPIRAVTVEQRTASGRAARILLSCEADRLEMRASTFRFAVDRALGWNRLRSDLYSVHLVGADAVFEGRGYGHGVGLSQAGARALAMEGRDTRAILRTYFPGAEVRMTANDSGWQRHEGEGWTLVSGAVDEGMVKAGDAAWRRAVALLAPRTRVHPEVRLYPTLALFRGVTGEPGWTLAATRDDRIALQPAALLARNHPDGLLVHEMLHVVVEHEAAKTLPLWFREGLVEALSEPSDEAGPAVPLAEIEARLAHPASLVQAQRAHRDAAAVVRQLMRVYGEATVVGWVDRGLPGDALGRIGVR
jgi:stage II sporulation protein D